MPYANYPTDLAKRELLTSCLTQGMQVTHLTVLYAQELDEKCWRQDYKDLRMITIDIRSKLLHDSPFTISWFSEISSYYPNLHKIQFVVYSDGDLNLRCLPFLTSFIERSRHQQLEDITLKELAISRASRPSSCQDFYVSKVTVVAQPSLIEHLSVLSASFQDTEKLTIQSTQNNRFEYDIDDLINALARFKSLQLLRSWDLFRLLVRNKPEVLPFTPFPPLESTLSPKRVGVEAEYWVYWFVNQIALSVPSLQVLRVDENGYGQLQSRGRTRWYLDGWLEVQAESRAIINALELFDDEML
ncbi:hypothetical protein D9757_005313 [Collybiopsis confluens]|uniref:Uncharacterized protein n=1 Tax=Collybiopsis confluens TaxID=2823264 RepID=A0A8H5ME85_9AGAR|nr:hypothetical protein D9757_005313 [Collybiopsis confluens]